MTTSLTITTAVEADHYLITGQINAGATLPREVFVYKNNGTTIPGEFWGTCSLSELGSIPVLENTAIPMFGNRFVRRPEIKILVDLNDDPASVVTALVNNVKSLNIAYNTQAEKVQTFTLP